MQLDNIIFLLIHAEEEKFNEARCSILSSFHSAATT